MGVVMGRDSLIIGALVSATSALTTSARASHANIRGAFFTALPPCIVTVISNAGSVARCE